MDYFIGLDISMDETHEQFSIAKYVVVRESKSEDDGGGYRRRIGESAGRSSYRTRDRDA